MAYQARVLVIANQTAGSPELVAALKARQERGPIAAHVRWRDGRY